MARFSSPRSSRGEGDWPLGSRLSHKANDYNELQRSAQQFQQWGYSPGPLTRPCMRSFLSRGKFAWCLAPGGASGVRSRPAPARRNLGGAKCRWPDPCQGRSRRRRWPKASLYKGLASDDDRRPRSVGRDYAHLSLDLSPLPRAGGQRPPLVDEPSAFVEGTWACAPSLSRGLTTRLVSRVVGA